MATDELTAGCDYALVEVWSGCGDGMPVAIICNRKRFVLNFARLHSLGGGAIERPLIK
jgi:hypothetical protein